MSYLEAKRLIDDEAKYERPGELKKHRRSSSGLGVHHPTMRRLMAKLGATWTPTMRIGSGCTVHVREGELPTTGRHILSLSRHYSALVSGAIHDKYDPSRHGTRCVYGYWTIPATKRKAKVRQ